MSIRPTFMVWSAVRVVISCKAGCLIDKQTILQVQTPQWGQWMNCGMIHNDWSLTNQCKQTINANHCKYLIYKNLVHSALTSILPIWDIVNLNLSCKFYFIILFYFLFCSCGDWCCDILAWPQEDGNLSTIGHYNFIIVQIMFEINLQW